ncbi:hypothetical protein [Aureivirga marina]|uniref:hypothetical protein n=1 Tax=Aureivirga marina TaxID=1182451 RepID=UPI0018C8DF74|nr:hypothetical protein [Aureivirga marina]
MKKILLFLFLISLNVNAFQKDGGEDKSVVEYKIEQLNKDLEAEKSKNEKLENEIKSLTEKFHSIENKVDVHMSKESFFSDILSGLSNIYSIIIGIILAIAGLLSWRHFIIEKKKLEKLLKEEKENFEKLREEIKDDFASEKKEINSEIEKIHEEKREMIISDFEQKSYISVIAIDMCVKNDDYIGRFNFELQFLYNYFEYEKLKEDDFNKDYYLKGLNDSLNFLNENFKETFSENDRESINNYKENIYKCLNVFDYDNDIQIVVSKIKLKIESLLEEEVDS